MAKLTSAQIRSLIRESIKEIHSEREANNFKDRLQLKIAERRLISFEKEINELSLQLNRQVLAEGWLDDLKDKVKGMGSSTLGTLDRAFLDIPKKTGNINKYGEPEVARSEFAKGGVTPKELEDIAKRNPMLSGPGQEVKKIVTKDLPSAIQKFKSLKFTDFTSKERPGLLALNNVTSTIINALDTFMKLKKSYPQIADNGEYLTLAGIARRAFDEIKDNIIALQEELQQASIDLGKIKQNDVESIFRNRQ